MDKLGNHFYDNRTLVDLEHNHDGVYEPIGGTYVVYSDLSSDTGVNQRYQKIVNWYIQYGYADVLAGVDWTTVYFPITFPTKCIGVTLGGRSSGISTYNSLSVLCQTVDPWLVGVHPTYGTGYGISNTHFYIGYCEGRNASPSVGSGHAGRIYWKAIGY
jgi:hypothetical protein